MKKYFLKISGHFKTTHELLKIHLFYMQLEFFFLFSTETRGFSNIALDILSFL